MKPLLNRGFTRHTARNFGLDALDLCASEGARFGARADATPQDGVARARQMIRASLADRYADNVTSMTSTVDGVQVFQIRVLAPLPVLGPLGPDHVLSVQARAFSENQ